MQIAAFKEQQPDTQQETFPAAPNQTPSHETGGKLRTDRDAFVLRWIGQHSAIRRNQLHRVLSHSPEYGVADQVLIGKSRGHEREDDEHKKSGFLSTLFARMNRHGWSLLCHTYEERCTCFLLF